MKIVDLTLPLETGMAGIPGHKYPVRIEAVTVVSEEQRAILVREGVDTRQGAEVVNTMNTMITITSHVGTHIDAPRHVYSDGEPIDRMPLDRIAMREAIVIDVSHKAAGEGVTAEDLERSGVRPQASQVVVIKTRWTDRAWGTPEFWSQIIYLEPSVSEWTERYGVAAVAMDCFPEKPVWRMTVEPHERRANHRRWLKAGIPMIQMLTRLDELGPKFTIVALPLKLKGMDGSPARVIGIDQLRS